MGWCTGRENGEERRSPEQLHPELSWIPCHCGPKPCLVTFHFESLRPQRETRFLPLYFSLLFLLGSFPPPTSHKFLIWS